MIILNTSRQYVQTAKQHFFPYINLYKQTRLNNVAHQSTLSEEYLSAVVINCLLTEINSLMDKKLINTTGPKIKLQFTEAQGIVLYKSLMVLPLPAEQVYFQMIRNEWLQILDMQLLQGNIYQLKNRKEKFAESGDFNDEL